MIVYEEHPVFRNRADAGQRLAESLSQYRDSELVVFAVPRGGVPVAIEVADKLGAPLDVVTPRKITIPYNPEAKSLPLVPGLAHRSPKSHFFHDSGQGLLGNGSDSGCPLGKQGVDIVGVSCQFPVTRLQSA